jgi:predicted porin
MININNVVTHYIFKRERNMKKHLIAAAALATLSTAAFAQNVTVYGIVDLALSKTTGAAAAGSKTALADATWMPSVFGFTGTEDLGGGMKASFNLESDVNMDVGQTTSASGNKLFGRKSNVAVSGGFGELKLGKDIDQIFLQGFIDNVRNSHSSSGFIAHTVAAAGTTLSTDSVFTQNLVRYTTPTVSGFKASVQHMFGEQAGNNSFGTSTSLLANYSNAGLSISVGTKKSNDVGGTAGSDTELTYVGATYQLGQFRLSTTHWETKAKGTNTAAKVKTQEYGVGYAVSPKLTAAVNYVDMEKGVYGSDITSASLKYALSKRTSVWALVSRAENDDSAQSAIYGSIYNNGVGTNKGTATALGITHSF